jgi:hypothetical protein
MVLRCAADPDERVCVCSAVELSMSTPPEKSGRRRAPAEGVEPPGNGFGDRSASESSPTHRILGTRNRENRPDRIPDGRLPDLTRSFTSWWGACAAQQLLLFLPEGGVVVVGRTHGNDHGTETVALRPSLPHVRHDLSSRLDVYIYHRRCRPRLSMHISERGSTGPPQMGSAGRRGVVPGSGRWRWVMDGSGDTAAWRISSFRSAAR